MKSLTKILAGGVAWGWLGTTAWAPVLPPVSDSAPLRAIEQAPDPSAAVAAFANATTGNRNDPRLYRAFVARMVELGLPELAYHQAQTLTTLQSTNGLAWGVVAYVEARRGQMAEAIGAVNLAAQSAPDNAFVAHTAGELSAWYDFKADPSKLPDTAKTSLAKVRSRLAQQSAFAEAYLQASQAYQAQAKSAPTPAQISPSENVPAQVAPGQTSPVVQIPEAFQAPSAPQVLLAPQAGVSESPLASAPPVTYAPPPAAPPYYPDYYGTPYYGEVYS